MSYAERIHSAAAAELARRRDAAEKAQQARHSHVLAILPDIAVLEQELAMDGLAVVKAIGMGKDAAAFIEELSKSNLEKQRKIKEALVSNGFAADYLEVKYACPLCNDSGFIGGIACECFKSLLNTLADAELNETAPASECGFENFRLDYYPDQYNENIKSSIRERMSKIYDYCKNYAEDFDESSPSLFMYGATGLGKTHLSLAIASTATKAGYNVIYRSAQNLLRQLEKERFNSRGNDENSFEEEILNCDLLIIDDLGVEFSTQFTVAAIYNIINSRLNSRRPTIISSNLTDDELEAKYTQRVTSRIVGNFVPLLFLGKDIRQLKKFY